MGLNTGERFPCPIIVYIRITQEQHPIKKDADVCVVAPSIKKKTKQQEFVIINRKKANKLKKKYTKNIGKLKKEEKNTTNIAASTIKLSKEKSTR